MAKKKSSNSPKRQSKTSWIAELFEMYQKRANREDSANNEYDIQVDFDPVRTKRRIAAAESFLPTVKGIVLGLWPDIPDAHDIEVDWAHANAQIVPSYDIDEKEYCTLLGAAIWILDELRENGKLEEAIRLLPKDNDILSSIDLPMVRDSRYSEEVLRGMVYILKNRNNDCENRTNSLEINVKSSAFMDLNTARKKHRQKVDSRLLFETILDFVPTDAKKNAVKEYEEAFWDWVRRYYCCWKIYHRKRIWINKEQARFSNLAIKETEKSLFSIESRGLQQFTSTFYRKEEDEALDSDYYHISQKINALWMKLRETDAYTVFQIEDIFGEALAKYWEGFTICDPYQFCFAFLYLIDSGSDLPWLYFPGKSLFLWTAARLPWVSFSSSETNEYEFIEGDVLTQIDFSDCGKWYELQYEEYAGFDSVQYRNLAQIIYNKTRCLLPRQTKQYTAVFPELEYDGEIGDFAAGALSCIMSILEESCQDKYFLSDAEYPEISAESECATNDTTVSVEDLKRSLSAMQCEIAQLKLALHDVSRELRDEKIKSASIRDKLAFEHQELVDLRTLIYHQQEDTYQSEKESTEVDFPYSAINNIVVFGGHDSWLREIRQKLDNVRFMGREYLPNAELIRNADMVWIQPNALSHAFFYKIINEVRKYKIRLRYFTYASATKCAEELVEADRKMKK